MRPYRGLTKDGKWVYGDLLQHNNIKTIHSTGKPVVEVIPETVGQATGLKDKNGKKKVYVDDDIYFSMSQTQHYKGYVKWSEKGLCYIVECYWEKQDEIPYLCDSFEMKYKDTLVRRLSSECFDIEIIGTIHTHPELIKEKEDA